MIRRPPRSTPLYSSAASDVYKRQEVDGGYREARVEGVTGEQACPDCGVFSARVHSRTVQRVKDLPYGRPLVVRWHKRRWACAEPACRRRTFSEHTAQAQPVSYTHLTLPTNR